MLMNPRPHTIHGKGSPKVNQRMGKYNIPIDGMGHIFYAMAKINGYTMVTNLQV